MRALAFDLCSLILIVIISRRRPRSPRKSDRGMRIAAGKFDVAPGGVDFER